MTEHPSYQGYARRIALSRPDLPAQAELAARHLPTRRYCDRACCCSAAPAVIAVIPLGSARPPADLLLCGHHYRRSRAALMAKGAMLLDIKGFPLATAWPEVVS